MDSIHPTGRQKGEEGEDEEEVLPFYDNVMNRVSEYEERKTRRSSRWKERKLAKRALSEVGKRQRKKKKEEGCLVVRVSVSMRDDQTEKFLFQIFFRTLSS